MIARTLLLVGLLALGAAAVLIEQGHKPLVQPMADLPGLIQQIKDRMNPNLDPCNDFYQFACGTFLDKNPVPKNVSGPYQYIPDFDDIQRHNNELLAKIVTDDWPIISELYDSCNGPLDVQNADAISLFKRWAVFIEAVNLSNSTALMSLLGVLNINSVSSLYNMGLEEVIISVGGNLSRANIIVLEASGNTLNSASDYVSSNPEYQLLLSDATMAFSYLESAANARTNAIAVLNFESKLAQFASNETAVRTTLAGLNQATQLDWTPYFDAVTPGLVKPSDSVFLYTSLTLYQNFKSFIASQPPIVIYRFLEYKAWQFIAESNFSSCWLDSEPDDFCYEIFGGVNDFTQKDICAEIVHLALTDYVGHIFTLEIVNDDLLADVRGLTNNIQNAFKDSLPNLPWLTDQARSAVIFKLQNILQNIGHPNVLDRYTGLRLSPATYYTNLQLIFSTLGRDQLVNWRAPFNRSDDEFDPLEVNAFYDPETNTINFPAGILESPMFSYTWPALWQYARLAWVVGHENTHGFDNDGSQWNAFGFPIDIFDSATRAQFNNHSACISNLYSKYVVFGNTHINGEQTLGENIADIGGAKAAYRAYQKYISQNGAEFPDGALLGGFSTNQVFWIILGQTWCSVENEAYLRLQIQLDPHSPSKFRVNGPLSQFDQFATDFKCPAGSPMNPANRCLLW